MYISIVHCKIILNLYIIRLKLEKKKKRIKVRPVSTIACFLQ